MVQVFGLGHLAGLVDAKKYVDAGVIAILELFQDKRSGGFYNAINGEGEAISSEKLAYDQVFVLLAACTAKIVGSPRADELIAAIDETIEKYFWDEEYGFLRNSWDNNFQKLDTYRGINANMHAVEAFTAAFDVTGEKKYRDRAYRIAKGAIDGLARSNNWFLPEHFNEKWEQEKDFNIDNPADPFRPYGVTIGHLFEWSRLILHSKVQMAGTGEDLSWIDSAAISLYQVGREFGWAVDGNPGFVYTINWSGKPVVTSRMFWVVAEALMSAHALYLQTGDETFRQDYDNWWEYVDSKVIDKVNGSWFHELNPAQEVVEHTWQGKPDTYHAFNACLLPLYPFNSSFIKTVMAHGSNIS